MARPFKQGLDYFPLDVNIDQDDKIFFLEAKYGIEGFAIVVKLFMKIYSNGYYYSWSEREALMFSKKNSVDINVVNNLINDSINSDNEYSLFDKDMFTTYSILTSKGIQARYIEACSRRKDIQMVKEYMLIDMEQYENVKFLPLKRVNASINEVNANINDSKCTHDVDISTQRKGNRKEIEREREIEIGIENKIENIPDDKSSEDTSQERENVPIKKIYELYNSICTGLPRATVLSEPRKRSIRILYKKYSDMKKFETVFQKANASDFLRGFNDKGWKADLDWIMKETNFIKIMEDKYSNKASYKAEKKNPCQNFDHVGYDFDKLENKLLGYDLSEE